jgi:Amidohydrolase family
VPGSSVNAVVIVQGNRITAVSRKGQAPAYPANARVIHADGKFILPGLWDSQTIYNWYYGEMMLSYGVTSNIGIGNSGEIGAVVRDAILHGKLVGPRPFTAMSRIVTRNNNDTGLETMLTPNRAPKSAQETREYVKAFIAAGADMVIFQDGTLPLDYYQAGFDEANKAGKPVFTRAYGPSLDPRGAAMLGSKNLPHSAGIGAAISNTSPGAGVAELDLYADMNEAKAKDLIQILVQHGTALTPTFKMSYPGYPKDWARFEREDRQALSNPDLPAYYPAERVLSALAVYNNPPVTTERRRQGFQNLLRFHKMFVDAGGHLIPGGDTNASKIPGINIHHEFLVFSEAGVTPMQIIQGATKWAAEMINDGKELGTVETGKLADVIIVKQDPLRDITNLRQIDTVIFDGRQVELGIHPWFSDPFRRDSGFNPPVENLRWVAAFKKSMFGDNPPGGGRGGVGRGGAGGGVPTLPDAVLSPEPAIETISPIMLTEGMPTSTVTVKGFNFVRRSLVLFKGQSVPYQVVSPTEVQVTLESGLLKEAGWFDLVVKNPWPYNPDTGAAWGNGTSNKAHLIINYKY